MQTAVNEEKDLIFFNRFTMKTTVMFGGEKKNRVKLQKCHDGHNFTPWSSLMHVGLLHLTKRERK